MKGALRAIEGLAEISPLGEAFAQCRDEPRTVTVFKGWTRLTTDDHGEMQGAPLQGFYAANTHFLSHYEMKVNGEPVSHRLSAQLCANEWSTNGAVLKSADYGNVAAGEIPNGSIGVRVLRRIDRGWTELIFIKNNGIPEREMRLELKLSAPIRDDQRDEEMKIDSPLPWGGLRSRARVRDNVAKIHFERSFGKRKRPPTDELRRMYGDQAPKVGEPVTRALDIQARVIDGDARLSVRTGKITTLTARAKMGSRARLIVEVRYTPRVDAVELTAPECSRLEPLPREKGIVPASALHLDSSNSTLNMIFGQAMADFRTLGLPIFGKPEPGDEKFLAFNAGIPRYIGLFGRDNMVTAWQAPLFGLELYEPAISRVALLQGVKREDWRDEEVNRLPHERRLNPLSETGKKNRELYYGDVTSTPFFILALSTLYQWTGDRELLVRHRGTLERCCEWTLRRLREGGGFISYAPAISDSDDENRNQAWKDSGDAIVDVEGRVCVPPLAVAEIQGYAYQALIEAAELFRTIDPDDSREGYLMIAADLKEKFNRDFWMPDAKFYAVAIGKDERQIGSVASNIGHCLSTGIIDEAHVADVVSRLMAEDLFSGWGIRTLSSENPGYDPWSYHRGSVWPVENAMIANGFHALGWRNEGLHLAAAQLSVASIFPHMRLPEVISGHSRSDIAPTPGLYNYANLLQAWSVSAVAQHVQAILGLRPRADQGVLYVDPALPSWLRWIELRNFSLGKAKLHLRFWRDADGVSQWKVLAHEGAMDVRSGRPPAFGREARPSVRHAG